MDSRVVLIVAVVAAVLLIFGIGGYYIREWSKAHPVLSIVAGVAIFVACFFFFVADTPQFSAWLDCLSTHRFVCLS